MLWIKRKSVPFWKRELGLIFCGPAYKYMAFLSNDCIFSSNGSESTGYNSREKTAFRHLLLISYSIFYCHIHEKMFLVKAPFCHFSIFDFLLCCTSEIPALDCIAFFTPFINLVLMVQLISQ